MDDFTGRDREVFFFNATNLFIEKLVVITCRTHVLIYKRSI